MPISIGFEASFCLEYTILCYLWTDDLLKKFDQELFLNCHFYP